MRVLPTREVHLDFHTGPYVPDVGKNFRKEEFQAALKEGNVNSITVFAKCHHGFTYYPSGVSRQHPSMEPGFDLTGAMVDAAHEIGVQAPIYITLGWSEDDAKRHPEWVMRGMDEKPLMGMPDDAPADAPRPYCCWDTLCPSGDYAELEYALVEEVSKRYPVVDGIFIDIVYMGGGVCRCPNCTKRMLRMGRDPANYEDNRANYEETHHIFAEKCGEILHRYHPEASIFFNSGGAEIYYPNRHADQTHFEMEDLPTAWGGYDKFLPRASVMRRRGKELLGMTGKFHTVWGEFGGYKNPDALTYEVLMMGLAGVKCSVGDQMIPTGRLDTETYRLLGKAYRAFEAYEPWFFPAESTTRLGVYLSGDEASDGGLASMLQEGQLDFEVVLPGDDLKSFDCLILPDSVRVSDEEAQRLQAFPGAILASGTSIVKDGSFFLDVGADYVGEPDTDIDYLQAAEGLKELWVRSPFLCDLPAQRAVKTDGEELAKLWKPQFSRTKEKFCSHRNTPYEGQPSMFTGAVRKGNRIWFAHSLCAIYHRFGPQLARDAFLLALRTIYEPKAETKLGSAGRIRLTKQPGLGRYVLHLAYGQPIKRGDCLVLEDFPELRDVPVRVRIDEPVKAVKVVPEGKTLAFAREADGVSFLLPKLRLFASVEIELE